MPLTIVACVKQVPDSWAEKRLLDIDSTLDRESADPVLNELDEYAIEEALRIREAQGEDGSEVVVLCMGPERATDTIRKALADELLFGRLANGGKVTVDLDAEGKVRLAFDEEVASVA